MTEDCTPDGRYLADQWPAEPRITSVTGDPAFSLPYSGTHDLARPALSEETARADPVDILDETRAFIRERLRDTKDDELQFAYRLSLAFLGDVRAKIKGCEG